jgi:four helix bundle protein
MPTPEASPHIQSFRDLQVWQRAMDLSVAVYHFTETLPSPEQFGLCSQLRRSSVSVPSNIAEGQGRLNSAEFRQFLAIARGSNCELQTQLELSRRLRFGDASRLQAAVELSHEVGKMLYALIHALPRTRH